MNHCRDCGDRLARYCDRCLLSCLLEAQLAVLKRYAWWKDGVEYVGCGTRTYADAAEVLRRETNETLTDLGLKHV